MESSREPVKGSVPKDDRSTPKLIFDVGMHTGEDTAFYLAKGFDVVSVEANASLCRQVAARFPAEISDGRLTILNVAIAAESGQISFFENENTIWSTTSSEWRDRNEAAGFSTTSEKVVEARTLASIIGEFGIPHYVKIDIEGADLVALTSLEACTTKPLYVSIESNKTSFKELRAEIDTFRSLGYSQFKVVAQRGVEKRKLKEPAREGLYVDYKFPHGSSGPFGEEAPGRWMSLNDTLDAYKRVFLGYAVRGDDPFVKSRLVRGILGIFGFRYDWFDTHAKLGSG